ncbi:YegP family protein [Halorhabdus sp. BNX81]|uniref:YegP family protein n=1 Tax=Halorhabdus sp. BNX81 TaxID=2980181 RepID=UPI0023DD2536|nr:YegP family protein [Halorhabdus sp. BNX81]WEL22841.1 putative membrane protein [Halorhabdus sp. BNX81]
MAVDDIRDQKLVELYHRYIGEPESKRDIYGYWLLLLGSLTGLLGVFVFQIEQHFFAGNFEIREIAIVLSAIGLALGLFAVVVLLPVRRRGMQASILGLAIAFLSIIAFTQIYPGAWTVGPAYSAELIAVYTLGIGIIVAVAILVPIVTGEKGLLVEPELGLGDDEAPILVGDATRDAFFTVFETPTNDWTWRTIQRDAIGQSATTVATDTDARMEVQAVREKIAGAGLLDITTAAFRLYQTESEEWEWSLVTADGSIISASDDAYADRDAIESAVNFLKEETPNASLVEIQGAAFDITQDEGDRWHWRLIDERHRPLAAGPDAYGEEANAEAAIDRFLEWVEDPRALAVETIAIELFEDGDGWRWRVIDDADNPLVTSDGTFDSRGEAEAAGTTMARQLSAAAVIEHGSPGYEVYESDSWSGADSEFEPANAGWTWRLRDRADEIIATMHGHATDEGDATASAERTRSALSESETIEFEGADYEVYPADEQWHWRLVSADRDVLADSTVAFADREEAETAADRVREQALAADLIEFEQAAFQQYESDGEWRWRLIDEDGKVMADSGESYEDKAEVTEGMRTLKENAPDAEVLEIDTAAFEIHLTGGGDYAWRLIDEGGKLIAESATSYPSRAEAREAVNFLIDHIDDAAVRAMEHATFQLVSDEETWGFWLVDTDGTILAESVEEYPTYDDVTTTIANVREAGAQGSIDTMGAVTVQLRQNAGYHWRLIDGDRNLAAGGERTYETRTAAETDIDRLISDAADAPVFDIGRGVIWIDRRGEQWQWRLIDADRRDLAVSPRTYESRGDVIDDVEMVQARAGDAERMDIETLAFEPYREGDLAGETSVAGDADGDAAGQWRWRLIDEDETVRAVSAGRYETRDAVADAIDEARETTGKASILEIDEVSFEFAQRDDGWIWRLIDENGSALAESVEPHDTRQSAREEMLTVKEHAPEGETVVSW